MKKVHNVVHVQRPNKKKSWWPSGKSLELRGLLPLWSLIINFRANRISRGTRKLAWTLTLN